MKKIILCTICIILFGLFAGAKNAEGLERFFRVQSVDTVKYSRDTAKDNLPDPTFDTEIDSEMEAIARTGATHIALGTPYDDEFVPFLARWVKSARNHGLKVWFRGNFAGWEGWFNYEKIDRAEHLSLTIQFIKSHSDLFKDGDIFTSCPECENGGPGDPRFTGDVDGHRYFLIEEYNQMTATFKSIGKNVIANYFSMNGDVAKLIMDRETTESLGGVVTIDHYVKDSETLMKDIEYLHLNSGGTIVLGEFGAPIPDIHGNMSDEKQAQWLEDVLSKVVTNDSVIGVNYWVNKGGSSRIWRNDNTPLPAVKVLTRFYKPRYLTGTVKNDIGLGLNKVLINTSYRTEVSDHGYYSIPLFDENQIRFVKDDYIPVTLTVDSTSKDLKTTRDVTLNAKNPSTIYKILNAIVSFFSNLWI